MIEQLTGLIFAGIGALLLLITILLLAWDSRRKIRYSETAIGTVVAHKWGHIEHSSYPYPVLSYNVGGIDYKRSLTYSCVTYNSFKHAEADWILDENYKLHIYVTRKCDRHINPMEDWFPLGSTMPVYYVAGKPWKSYCGALISMKLAGIITGFIGLFFTAFGLFMHFVL